MLLRGARNKNKKMLDPGLNKYKILTKDSDLYLHVMYPAPGSERYALRISSPNTGVRLLQSLVAKLTMHHTTWFKMGRDLGDDRRMACSRVNNIDGHTIALFPGNLGPPIALLLQGIAHIPTTH